MIGFMRSKLLRVSAAALAFCVLLPLTSAAAGSDEAAVLGVFNRAIRALNAGDLRAWLATCGPGASIVDEIPPHSWQGAAACANWWSSFAAYGKRFRISDIAVDLETPWHVVLDTKSAYLVVPAVYSYRQSGKSQREPGIFTVALKKTLQGWLISGWAWTKR
jgi:hypothetical protein